MIKFGLPTRDMLVGDKKLSFIDIVGSECAITDFGHEMGGIRFPNHYIEIDNGQCLPENLASEYYVIDEVAQQFQNNHSETAEFYITIRPIMYYDDIKELGDNVQNDNGVRTILYGEYVSKKVDSNDIILYRDRIRNGKMMPTGKKILYYKEGSRFNSIECIEYYDDEVKIKIAQIPGKQSKWFYVEPIRWYVDEGRKVCLAEKALTGDFFATNDYTSNIPEDINNSSVYQFLNEEFARDIVPTDTFLLMRQAEEEEREKAFTNPWNFEEEKEINDVMEEIRTSIEANVPIFIHGLYGAGKTDRVYQIDPQAYRISLSTWSYKRLNGVTALVSDEQGQHSKEEKPAWLVEFEKLCYASPDKLHILFLDELTNVEGEMQKCALDLALERKLQGIWKLPENARIVAAGNEVEDSSYAEEMPAPLFTRFVHCYVKTSKNDWLLWASEHSIHPAIYTFVACYGDEVLRDEFDGKNAIPTPRTWKMASDLLKVSKNPYIIKTAVGEKVTAKFIEFIKDTKKIITPQAVLSNLYDMNDVRKMSIAQKYATIMALTNVDYDNFSTIRDFVIELTEGNGEQVELFEN